MYHDYYSLPGSDTLKLIVFSSDADEIVSPSLLASTKSNPAQAYKSIMESEASDGVVYIHMETYLVRACIGSTPPV